MKPSPRSPLTTAVLKKKWAEVSRLVSVRGHWLSADPQQPVLGLLMEAGYWDLAESVWTHALPVSVINGTGPCTSLHAAVRAGRLDWADRLLNAGVPVESAPTYPILRVVLERCRWTGPLAESVVPMIERLVAAGADLEAQDSMGTFLMNVVAMGREELVLPLLNLGASPHAVNKGGNTALMFAARRLGHLVSRRTHATQVDQVWTTPAADTMVALIAAGAALDVANLAEETAEWFYLKAAHANMLRPPFSSMPTWASVIAHLGQRALAQACTPSLPSASRPRL